MPFPYYTEPTHDQGTAAAAARTTATSKAEGRLIVDAADKIFLLEPNRHPLVSLLTNVGKTYDSGSWKGVGIMKKSTGNPEFAWFEDFYGGRYCTVNMGGGYAASGAITITVDGAGSSSANIFTAGDIVRNATTGENMLVDSVASSTTVDIAAAGRAFGTTAAAAGSDDDGLYIVGNVSAENAGARNVNTTRASKETNYTQIFKTTVSVSGTEKEANLYGGKDLPYFRAKMGTQHALDIERAFWWSEKKEDTTNHPKRATGGIEEWIVSKGAYTQDQGGAITAPDLNTFLREGFTYGSDTKYLFAGGIVLQGINEIARGQIQMKPLAKSYGMQIATWVTAFGTVNIVHNPLFTNDYAGSAYMIDMDCLKYRFMNNRDTKLLTNVQAPDVDGEIDQYISEVGLQRMQAAKCAYLYGVTD